MSKGILLFLTSKRYGKGAKRVKRETPFYPKKKSPTRGWGTVRRGKGRGKKGPRNRPFSIPLWGILFAPLPYFLLVRKRSIPCIFLG